MMRLLIGLAAAAFLAGCSGGDSAGDTDSMAKTTPGLKDGPSVSRESKMPTTSEKKDSPRSTGD